MLQVVGVNGCPGGWLAISWDTEGKALTPAVHRSFADLLSAYPDAAAIAVDIPIGLAADGPRQCDVEARKVLGPRRSSVFPAPHPNVLDAPTYEEALALAKELTGKGISKQSFAIHARVAEVNRALTPELQQRVFEVHPEVCFWALAGGRPMNYPKKILPGFEERRGLLRAALGIDIPDLRTARGMARPAGADDVLDAIVAAWTAHRFATGNEGRFPKEPLTDANGLRMEMVY